MAHMPESVYPGVLGLRTTLLIGLESRPLPEPVRKDLKLAIGEFYEHDFIGNSVKLTQNDGKPILAREWVMELPNHLRLNYGEISAVAGDFYGTSRPISDGQTADDRARRFKDAWVTLAEWVCTPKEARAILAILKSEVDAVNNALKQGEDPSKAYSELKDVTKELWEATMKRPSGFPNYLELACINWDHFGQDARATYETGHQVAIEYATMQSSSLERAYTLNAFADHFLQDSFSAGHLRVPRRALHGIDRTPDLCAKLMHDEDSALGLSVWNNNETWTAYGDKRLLDTDNKKNLDLCRKALQVSVDEIYTAWKTKQAPSRFKIWDYAPILQSAYVNQVLTPLFTPPEGATRWDVQRRSYFENRRKHQFTKWYTFFSTAAYCYWGKGKKYWAYPMLLDY